MESHLALMIPDKGAVKEVQTASLCMQLLIKNIHKHHHVLGQGSAAFVIKRAISISFPSKLSLIEAIAFTWLEEYTSGSLCALRMSSQ